MTWHAERPCRRILGAHAKGDIASFSETHLEHTIVCLDFHYLAPLVQFKKCNWIISAIWNLPSFLSIIFWFRDKWLIKCLCPCCDMRWMFVFPLNLDTSSSKWTKTRKELVYHSPASNLCATLPVPHFNTEVLAVILFVVLFLVLERLFHQTSTRGSPHWLFLATPCS